MSKAVRFEMTLDGVPVRKPQMGSWAEGWSASDILDDVADQVAERRFSIPGAVRYAFRSGSDTSERAEIFIHGFSDPSLYDEFVAREDAELERERRERQQAAAAALDRVEDASRRHQAKLAEAEAWLAEAEAFNRDESMEQQARKERKAVLADRERRLMREMREAAAEVEAARARAGLPTAA